MSQILWNISSDRVLAELKQGRRLDGRKLDECREMSISGGISKNAEGSAAVKLGQTEVMAGIKMLPGEPYPDSPDKGTIAVGMELLPLASPAFEVGPPRDDAIELARVIDRGVRESKALDFKKLCVTEGELVWIVFIDIYALNDSGNLFDAGSAAALAALNSTQIPKLEENKVVYGEYSGKLKLERQPLLSTFAKIGNSVVLDPNLAEWHAASARFSVATTDDGYMCAFQKGLGGTFTKQEISDAIDTAAEHGSKVRKLIGK